MVVSPRFLLKPFFVNPETLGDSRFPILINWATKKRVPGWLGYIGGEILSSYIGIIRIPINQPGFNGKYPMVFLWLNWGHICSYKMGSGKPHESDLWRFLFTPVVRVHDVFHPCGSWWYITRNQDSMRPYYTKNEVFNHYITLVLTYKENWQYIR